MIYEDYDEKRDIMFYKGESDYATLNEGYFMILFPEDGHKPWLCVKEPRSVKKVVIKIPVE